MTKRQKFIISAICIIVSLMLCAIIVLSVFTFKEMHSTADMVKTFTGVVDDIDAEDDVLIATKYLIKSTRHISDAYISGDVSQLDDKDKETLSLASDVLSNIIKDGMDDYEKELAIYTYLTSQLKSTNGILTVINTENENYEPRDVLKYKNAVCVGYATTFRLLCQMENIECKIVHSSDLSHSWNIVKLDDGWYHTDCYSDADSYSFSNFNMNDEMCAINHMWNKEYFPQAEGKKYNYAIMNCKQLKSVYDLADKTAKGISDKKTFLSFKFKDFNDKKQREAQYMADAIQDNMSNENASVSYQWISDSNNGYILIINISYMNSYAEELSVEETDKIDSSIYDAIEKYNLG